MTRPILDACCGGRMMWFDKANPAVVYMDKREVAPRMVGKGRHARVRGCVPDVVADFTDIPYPDDMFVHVVMDPPHLVSAGAQSHLRAVYGVLPKDWESEIRQGVNECMRVLRPGGTLILKWSEVQISLGQVLAAIEWEPLYGHTTTSRQHTHWMCFVKGVSARREHVQEVMAL
jgi:SAM-dependent methyltransferase